MKTSMPAWINRLLTRGRSALRHWRQRVRHGQDATIPAVSLIVRNDLDRANAALEHVFLDLGRHFEPLAGRMQQLVDSGDALRALAGGQEQGETVFQRAIGVLRPPLEFIDRCVSQHTRLLELVRRCEEEMAVMLRFQMQMTDLLAPLSFVEVLFRVESASLELEQRETFGTVAADIQRLRRLVDEAFQKNSTLLGSTHAALGDARRRLENDFHRHASAIASKREQIEAALARLDGQLVQNARQETDSRGLTRMLCQRISAVVSALQHQDIIKQKCSHVVDALVDWERHHVYDRAFVELQLAQLETVDADIDRAVDEIVAAMGAIRELSASIDQRSLSMEEVDGMIASADGMVQMLLDAIRDTHAIVASTATLIGQASEAARPAGNIAANLTSTLGELSINMRLVALNAQVRSVQITHVTGLEVLAVRTADISNRITAVSREVSGRLARLRDVTSEMFSIFDQLSGEGRATDAQMQAAQAPVEQELHRLRDQTLSVFRSIGETVHEVSAAVDRLNHVLGDVPQAHGALRKAMSDLAEFGREHCDKETGLSDTGRALVEAHAAKYTMASERHVHAAATGGQAPAPAPAGPAGRSSPHAPGGRLATVAAARAEDGDSGVELF